MLIASLNNYNNEWRRPEPDDPIAKILRELPILEKK